MPAGIVLPVAPDPLAIARRFAAAGLPHVALLLSAERGEGPMGRWSFVAAAPDRSSRALDPLDDDPNAALAAAEAAGAPCFAGVPRWIGVVPYEHRRTLERAAWTGREARPAPALVRPEWYRYPAVVCVDHLRGEVLVVGRHRTDAQVLARAVDPARQARPALPAYPRDDLDLEVADAEPLARHAERIAAAKELIAAGDLYQVNLARAIRVVLRRGSSLDLTQRLVAAAPTPLGACLHLGGGVSVVSTTPELLLRASAARKPRLPTEPPAFDELLTVPIKGSRPRGPDAEADRALALELDADPKERAELTMILDVERNDLGRVARIGSVRVPAAPRIVTHRTIHHREAAVVARASPDASRTEVLESVLPSGSVTGAPKVRAMEVIARLEPRRRGLYTGGLGFVAHDGSVTLAMAIRTVVLTGDPARDGSAAAGSVEGGLEGEYLTGGGIVADSDPEREVEETRWKALQLEHAARRAPRAPAW